MVITYKYRLKDKNRKEILRSFAFGVNQAWNFCSETQRKTQQNYKDGMKSSWLGKYDFQNLTAGTSKELGIAAQTIQEACCKFVSSRDTHKKRPKFRVSSGPKRSLGWVPFTGQDGKCQGNSVTYRKTKFRFFGAERRPVPGKVLTGCFCEDSQGKWYVCLQVDVPKDDKHGESVIGIDLGLKELATTSEGEVVAHPRFYRKLEPKLAKAQKCGNKKKVKKIHVKIKNQRLDYLHKETSKLIKSSQFIAVGNVSSSKLAKTSMAKSVLDAGWGMFKSQLRYKASRHGVVYKEVNESFTTQTCSQCGAIPPESPKGIAGLGMRDWMCSLCGASHDRDVNSARNILKLGLSAQPPVEGSRKKSLTKPERISTALF